MKELSIEENAKVHTELINRLEDVKDAIKKQNYGIAMDILYKPYPEFQITTSTELKESEDERIINFLIKQANSVLDSMTDDDEEVPAWKLALSWLEKQGEQKPAWSEEDEEMLNLIIARLHSHPNVELEEYGKSHDWLKSLKDRVQPKQKWSEEGKQYLKIEGYENLSDYEKIFDDIADKYVRNKNQKGYNQSWYVKERAAEMLYHAKKELEKKESWSEEDGDIRDNVIRDLKRLSGDMVSPNQTYQKEIQWLKSLRPQNRWKPSDEQINTLQDAIVYVKGYNSNFKGSGSVLEKLYRDLKKLREE